MSLSSGGNQSPYSLNDLAYSASPNNTFRRGKKPRDNGFHSEPAGSGLSRRRKAAIAVGAFLCVVAAIFVVRATVERDERLQRPWECTDTYDADICELIEPVSAGG